MPVEPKPRASIGAKEGHQPPPPPQEMEAFGDSRTELGVGFGSFQSCIDLMQQS